ncbi:hypothetical protein ACFE04_016029 [Oxalis oulophora]
MAPFIRDSRSYNEWSSSLDWNWRIGDARKILFLTFHLAEEKFWDFQTPPSVESRTCYTPLWEFSKVALACVLRHMDMKKSMAIGPCLSKPICFNQQEKRIVLICSGTSFEVCGLGENKSTASDFIPQIVFVTKRVCYVQI